MYNTRLITIVVGILALLPLLLNTAFMWDAIRMEMTFLTGDPFYIEAFLSTQFTKYYILLFLNKVCLVTGIGLKTVLNIITVVSVCGIAYETFKYLRDRLGLDVSYAYFGAWAVLTYPTWHSLASGVTFQSILCVWLFMIAVNMWRTRPLLALMFFIPSLQFFSIFAFAVGFAGAEFVLSVNKDNYKREITKMVLFGFALAALFIPIYLFGNIHSGTGSYNTFNVERLPDILEFCIYALGIFGLALASRKYMKLQNNNEHFIRCVLVLLLLAFFSAIAYWAVGRPMRFFNFGSFSTRFSYLTSVPFAVGLAVFGHYIASRWSNKARRIVGAVLLTALIVIVNQGHSHKAAAVIFKEMLIQSLQAIDEPPSGYVAVHAVDYEPPRHVHMGAINVSFYKAYGKRAWMVNGFWRRGRTWDKASLAELYGPPSPYTRKRGYVDEVTGTAFSHYRFHLDGYHQEGRFWYLWYYLTDNYDAFKPRLELVEQTPSTS